MNTAVGAILANICVGIDEWPNGYRGHSDRSLPRMRSTKSKRTKESSKRADTSAFTVAKVVSGRCRIPSAKARRMCCSKCGRGCAVVMDSRASGDNSSRPMPSTSVATLRRTLRPPGFEHPSRPCSRPAGSRRRPDGRVDNPDAPKAAISPMDPISPPERRARPLHRRQTSTIAVFSRNTLDGCTIRCRYGLHGRNSRVGQP